MSAGRVRKVAERIQVIVAEMLERRIKDARLGFVTITDVRVTGDTPHATIFYTVLGDEEQRTASGAALESAKGLIRSEVGKQLGMRHTPTLEFILDALPESAAHIEDLLAQARRSDAEVAAVAAGATYAGEADPYKHPDDDESDDVEVLLAVGDAADHAVDETADDARG
jgi:ribosome-binding factor A